MFLLKIMILGRVVIFEEKNTENESSIEQKEAVWKHWDGTLDFLSKLTSYKIPSFDFVNSDNLQNFLKTIQEEL